MIIVNARFLSQPVTGVQRFALEISKILKQKLKNKVFFVTSPGVIHHELANELDAKVIGVNKSHLWEQLDLYAYILRKNKPLLISFGYTGPLFYKNQIISVHDVAFIYYRETFSKAFGFIYNFLVPKISKKCLHVLTVSESVKKEVCKELDLPVSKVTVIYNGISGIFKNKNKTRKSKKLNKPYILTVSSHHPRKNYERLIEAFHKVNNDTIELYIIGNFVGHFSDNIKTNEDKRIHFLTQISDEQLVEYYKGAELFVFPSLYEGFGIPIIEAMSQNLPCVISDIPVFREIGDDSVIYVNPKNTNSIAQGIEKGLKLNRKINDYPKIDNFSWEKSANKVIELLSKYHDLQNE
ncbi:glycosyltransferase family 4 protein [Hwangdonia lutea]|uniref:Glycosyltransferase family 1 protein n=1 Tax=Hwangdonia lutea TaxID=3075823 RepID=A0AA97EQ55_9FLAO|nr:glycosyltransferase family 1 protein [Hwangdonia sp. SCSIO 19198]WOD45051.1 glycosyltransferase family 1 protein [Hwangdonia sp. SCSIO 19198]